MSYLIQGDDKDCAIISICNYTGKTYSEVLTAAMKLNILPKYIRERGTPSYAIPFILLILTGKIWHERKPRRGQEKINGLASWHVAGKKFGHMTAIVDGNVFDTDGSVTPISKYREVNQYHLRKVWIN